ncbi:Hpt domain-containing protein, partial [bacterium]|nr:Hpt domain-containing protein [bacterium]
MDNAIRKKLNDLVIAYKKNLPSKLLDIEAQWHQQLLQWDSTQFENLHRTVHSLCGSAGTYGHPELGKSARHLEVFLKTLLGQDGITKVDQEKITTFISQLKKVLSNESPQNIALPGANLSECFENKLVYIIVNDDELAQKLSDSLKHVSYRAYFIQDLITLQRAIDEQQPIAVIIDALYLDKVGIQLVVDIQKQHQQIPIQFFCIVPNEDLLPRLQAIRAGCDAFFQKPVDIAYLTQILNHKCTT